MASTQQRPRRRTWSVDAGDPATVLAEARKALFVMVGFLAVIWIVQVANWVDHYQLTQSYGIRPRDVGSLPDILTAPFLHVSWAHIEGNSGPLFIFGFLAAYRGVTKFFGVTALVVLTSGLGAWLTESTNSVGVGASGVVFGYFGYIMVRGLFDRHAIDLLIGAVMALCFAYQFSVLLPHAGIGWQAHIGGLAGGILAGWVLRERRSGPTTARPPALPRTGHRGRSGDTVGAMPAASRGSGRPGLWRHRDFLLLWTGQSISELGSAVTVLALPLTAVVVLRASVFQVGLLSAATTVPFLLVALPAGLVVDRVAKRTLMIGCDAARMLIIGSVPITAGLGELTLFQLYAVAVATGVLTVFFDVAYQSYTPALIGTDQLTDGNGKLQATQSFAQVAGPGLGGG